MTIEFLNMRPPSQWEEWVTHSWDSAERGPSASKRDVVTWSSITHPTEYAEITLKQAIHEDGYDIYWTSGKETKHKSVSVGGLEHDFIRKVFKEVDKLLEPDFVETNPQDADILMLALSGDNEGVVCHGSPYPLTTKNNISVVQSWYCCICGYRERIFGWLDRAIVHEIGHALRLSHPYQKYLGDGQGSILVTLLCHTMTPVSNTRN